ncbi:MAG: adenylyl-sulfate kinase [Calditrichaeota bacterium]|nr:adenylyl-sulfate kinase [Calditrichota bacterium]
MIGDTVDLSRVNWRCVHRLHRVLTEWMRGEKPPVVIAIAGESGSGKTTLAVALEKTFREFGMGVRVLQQDDYYRLPPKTNDRRRREDISWVGPGEVNLQLLDDHLAAIRKGATRIEKPLVIYDEDRIVREVLPLNGVQIILVEGTYVSLLQQVHWRVFINRDYRDTRADRLQRGRDARDAFMEQVLAIEHRILRQHQRWADILITRDFRVRVRRRQHSTREQA